MDLSDSLWMAQAHIASGSYGRISIGPIPRIYLSPALSIKSGRVSRYSGNFELVAFKSPRIWNTQSEPDSIPFRDVLPEIIFLSAPDLLYHENIVDILGFFWEPHGKLFHTTIAPTLMFEFADHGSLRTFYRFGEKPSLLTKLNICIDICQALKTLHHELSLYGEHFAIYHGDLKPDNILIFSDREKEASTPKDTSVGTGSCVRYRPTIAGWPGDFKKGTPGWKAPEIVAHNTISDAEAPLVDTLKAEIFSFGLLVSYIVIETEPVLLPAMDSIIPDDLKPSHSNLSSCPASSIQKAQEWLILNRPVEFLETIVDAVKKIEGTEEEHRAVIDVLTSCLSHKPEDRASSFKDICKALGGDPDETRKRTPIEPIIDPFAIAAIQTELQGVVASVNLVAAMPSSFQLWLDQHFDMLLEHIRETNYEKKNIILGHIYLVRGLLSFVPPEVDRKFERGLEYLKHALDLEVPNISSVYSRLAASHKAFSLDDSWVARLIEHAQQGSLFAREDLLGLDNPIHVEISDTRLRAAMVMLEENSCLHLIAFMDDVAEMTGLINRAKTEHWNIEEQVPMGAELLCNGNLNYATAQQGTALHWSVAMNNLAAVERLVSIGASSYTENRGGITPWMLAVAARSLPMIKVFAERCQCPDISKRRDGTLWGIHPNSLNLYLATGRHLVSKSFEVFQYLWSLGEVSRQAVYESTVSVGPASSALLGHLLSMDYDPCPDEALLRGVLLKAVTFTDRTAVAMILERVGALKYSEYTMFLLHIAICSGSDASKEVFTSLLKHTDKENFDINVRFTFENGKLEFSETKGRTLLHVAFSRGKISQAIEILQLGGDPSILSLDQNGAIGQTPLGHLLHPRSHHNYLSLQSLIHSPFLTTHPTFVLDNAVIRPHDNYNIFHQLCQGEDERVHNSAGYRVSALNEVLNHFKALSATQPASRSKFLELLNAPTTRDGETRFTPLLLAVSSGFSQAIPLLCENGADLFVGFEEEALAVFAAFASRSPAAFSAEFQHKYTSLQEHGFPWIDPTCSVAAEMRSEYAKRSDLTEKELKKAMQKSELGRKRWEKYEEWKERNLF
ncbi:hypothetical protein BCR34DRAFT_510962 [Clohesyomyces aquaticus]|uniref:Protein kinase domain-containing protein n=1 Tax=Clohesyomyces aquaticus TaxID=1231657 RepID=A0A1Y1ZT97_9PLEO|nr:hypothetical protein BCR34DRAFT_510962 [Clohesyomyces aquaticus]